jgi:hypothetical protein
MVTKNKKQKRVRVQVYFNTEDKLHMQVLGQLQELQKSTGVSLSNAAGMALRRGVPLVKGDWDALMQSHKK